MKPNKRRGRRTAKPLLPLMVGEMAVASVETIGRRLLLIARGRCSAAEYRRMVLEKVEAARRSAAIVATSAGKAKPQAVLAPWHGRVTANAKRLRKR
ncbi:MAG: hypothetical protein MUE49_05890 [Rhodospirillales bacterium]|jgi:hypothetical protein|nr:hypothetical protein [Rhodospirillales bacterium]